jgi:hypothetical protein
MPPRKQVRTAYPHYRTIAKIVDIAYHRNGVAGYGFHVVLFKPRPGEVAGDSMASPMVAVLFDASEDSDPALAQQCRTAVLAVPHLAKGNITFGSNSWRGDNWDDDLRDAIKRWNADSDKRLAAMMASSKRRSHAKPSVRTRSSASRRPHR